jgi:hypothetical protein
MPEGWDAVCAVPGAPVAFRRNGPGYRFVTLEVMRQLLATQGLHIVSEADRKVLDALVDVSDQELRDAIASPVTSIEVTQFARAELARRNPAP